MTGRWPCVVLVLALAACRTPQKNVSVYPLADDESDRASHLHDGSDVGETVTGRMNLPNFADTETTTNSPVESQPRAAGKLPDKSTTPAEVVHQLADVALPDAGKLPVKSTVPAEAIHLKAGALAPPAAPTNTTAHLDIPGRSSPQTVAPVSQSIHLSWPAWTNAVVREPAGSVGLAAGPTPAPMHRPLATSMNIPINVASNAAGATGSARAVALPAVGAAAPNAVEALSKPVDLAPLLDGAHDEAWRQRQAEQQRAAENARQSARDSLEKTLQQFLQPTAK